MKAITYFKALADETRLRLLHLLVNHELSVGEIVTVLEMGQSRVSRHLKILAEADLVEHRRDGLWVFYRAVEDGPGREFINAVSYLMREEDALRDDLRRAEEVMRERAQRIKQFFNNIAADWSKLSQQVLGDLTIADEVLSRMPSPCQVAADLGCGTGELLEALMTKANTVIGVDSSPKMLELAEKRLHTELASLRMGSLEHLPLRDAEADFIVISLVLHHLPKPSEGLREAWRVLAQGGQLVVVEFRKHENEFMRSKFGDRWLGFTDEDMQSWLSSAGFYTRETAAFSANRGMKVGLYLAEKAK